MKSVITTICVLIPLVILFVIIDRKDFYSGDDVTIQQETVTGMKPTTVTMVKPVELSAETKPVAEKKPMETKPVAETKPIETKPVAETKPADVKATETKPVAETKTAETKPVVETKPTEVRPTETKSTERKPVDETKPVTKTKPAEKKPSGTKPVVETKPATAKPAETKPVAETKLVAETKTAETKPMVETKPVAEENSVPVAVPVVSSEEAEKLNKVALDYLKAHEEEQLRIEEKKKTLFQKAKKVYSDSFKSWCNIGDFMSEKSDSLVIEKGYNLTDFRQRLLPSSWRDMDLSTLPEEASFGKDEEGFRITSLKNKIRFYTSVETFKSMNASFFFEAEIKNNSSNQDCKVDFGIRGAGNLNNGFITIKSFSIPVGETKRIKCDLDPYLLFYQFRPTVSFLGDATLKEIVIYRYVHPEITIVEGTIKDRSQIPDPKSTDYPDCSYTAHFVGNAIFEGEPCNKEIELTIDGFIDKKILASNSLKSGDIIKCAIIRFDNLPEIKSSGTQVADDLSLFELESYYMLSFQKIGAFSDPLAINADKIEFSDFEQQEKYVSIFCKSFNDKMSEVAKLAQDDMIKRDLKRINEMLAPYTDERKQELNERFQEVWKAEKQKDPPGYNRTKQYVWRNIDNAFYALPEQYTFISGNTSLSQDNIDALIAFKEYLELQGIQLIISPVPECFSIAARVINKEFKSVPDFRTAYLVKQLLENGIEAIYASDEIIQNYNKYPIPYMYPDNGHPADLPQDILSTLIAERISRFNLEKELDTNDFSVEYGNYGPGYWGSMAYPQNCDTGNHPAKSHFNYTQVFYKGKVPVNTLDSQIILMGNSFSYSPTNQSLMSFLAMKTGVNVYQFSFGSLGPFTTAIQRIFNNPEHYLKNKKMLVFQMGTGHFLSNASILNIKKLDRSMEITRNGKMVKKLDLTSNVSTIPSFAKELSNPLVYCIGSDSKATIYESDNIFEQDDSISPADNYFVEINYCCQETNQLSIAINSNKKRLTGGNYTFFWFKETLPLSLSDGKLQIEVLGKPGMYIAINSIKLYRLDE